MRSNIPVFLRKMVVRRAKNHCEYCHLSQKGQEATFHIDHIKPVALGGETVAENLALACVSCSLRKSAREKATDPQTNLEVAIFHPRNDVWNKHFEWKYVELIGLTPKGRATVELFAVLFWQFGKKKFYWDGILLNEKFQTRF